VRRGCGTVFRDPWHDIGSLQPGGPEIFLFRCAFPGSNWTGLAGKNRRQTFNYIVPRVNQQMAHYLKRVGQVVGKEVRPGREASVFTNRGGHPGVRLEVSCQTLVEVPLRVELRK